MKKKIKSKTIYQPEGRAGEYSEWACNTHNGCSNECDYCYNRHGLAAAVLGASTVSLKKSLGDEKKAYEIFCKELVKYRNQILASGGPLHFTFVSDPCLPETIALTWKCITFALSQGVPVQVLTKKADWLGHPAVQDALTLYRDKLKVGFTLTGRDDLEPGASTNAQRIDAMRILHDQCGITTWASIEPIITPQRSYDMITQSMSFCDHYKIGIRSGQREYTPGDIRQFVQDVNSLGLKSVLWKKSLLEFVQKP